MRAHIVPPYPSFTDVMSQLGDSSAGDSYSALQNDRPLFKKIGYDFFVYAVMCTRCVNKDFQDDGDRVARYKHFSYLTVTPPSAPLPASLSD